VKVLEGGRSTFMPYTYSYVWVQPEGEGFIDCPDQGYDHTDSQLVK